MALSVNKWGLNIRSSRLVIIGTLKQGPVMTGNPKREFKHQVEGLCALWRWNLDSSGSRADGVEFIGPTRIWTAHEKT